MIMCIYICINVNHGLDRSEEKHTSKNDRWQIIHGASATHSKEVHKLSKQEMRLGIQTKSQTSAI